MLTKRKKLINKTTIMLAVLALVTAMFIPFSGKRSQAADYLSAAPVSLNGTWSSDYYIAATEQEYWYKITLPKDGELEMRFMSYFDRLYWQLYNDDLSECIDSRDRYGLAIYGSETAPTTETYSYILSAGIYYVKLYSKDNIGKYRTYYQYTSYEANDGAAHSYDSPLNYQMGNVITGAITQTDREDWYKITIPSNFYYTIKIVSYFDRVYWNFYNADLSETVAARNRYAYGISGSATSPKTVADDLVLSSGTYYVKITGEYSGKYLFSLSKLTQKTCSHDYEKTWHDATYFARGYCLYRCKKCGYSYKGDYVAKKQLAQGYIYPYGTIGKGKVTLSWTTVSDASGYQIRYSRKRNMKNSKTINVKGQSKNKKTIKKLSRRKKYYIQVRAYKKSGSKQVYGKWSAKKYFKTK